MLFIRSLIFKIFFVLMTAAEVFLFLPVYFFLPHRLSWFAPRFWAKSTLWLLKHICGVNYRIEGLENLPQGAYIAAPKHQSSWEPIMLPIWIPDPAIVMQRNLLRIPVFSWYLRKMGVVPINQGEPLKALKILLAAAKKKIAQGRQILIFPEGARHEPGGPTSYKAGIYPIYAGLAVPVAPIALNAGLYWSPKRFCVYPGTIICRILPPIAPGLPRREFMQELETAIETECDKLLLAAASSPRPPYLPPEAREKLRLLAHKAA